MNLIHMDQLVVLEGRYRRIFDVDRIANLAESIEKSGLLHAPVCAKREEGIVLVAGECRVRAMKTLHNLKKPFCYIDQPIPPGMIPYSLFEELDELAAKEAELDENIRRADLSWQEQSRAVAELHALRMRQKLEWGLGDTAAELSDKGGSASITSVHDDILLSQHIDNPAVAKAKSKAEAKKALVKSMERDFLSILGEITPEIQVGDQLVRCVDAIEGMRAMPAETFDCICTDPPYGIGADAFNYDDLGTVNLHHYKDDWDTVRGLLFEALQEAFRIAKPEAHLYMFCDIIRFSTLAEIAALHQWEVWPRPFIWYKDNGTLPKPLLGPQRRYECIMFCNKGQRQIVKSGADVLMHALERNRIHAAQKPVSLYTDLLSRTVRPGNKIFDPFCGSGTIFSAGRQLKCAAVGLDNDPAAVELAKRRLKGDA